MTTTQRPRAAFTLAVAAVLALIVAGCGGSSSRGTETVTVTDGVARVTADNLRFNAGTIQATANEAFVIELVNMEAQPHNVSVYVSQGGEQIVEGEVVTGPDVTTQVNVPALEPGEYYFVCDVHPEMNGTLVVT
jgi:plastocyanin